MRLGRELQRLRQLIRQAKKSWHGVKLGRPDWSAHSHSLALEAAIPPEGVRIYLILNAYWEPLDFELPPSAQGDAGAWRRWIDTALPSPQDIVQGETAPAVSGRTYPAAARSVVVLFQDIGEPTPG